MQKNKLYVYGDDTIQIPAHVHLGKHILQTFMCYSGNMALLDADTGDSMTFEEVAQMSVDIAVSLYHMGVRKGDAVCICSEKRMEYMPTIAGIVCAGAIFLPADVTARNKNFLRRLDMLQPKIVFCSPDAYEIHKGSLKSTEYIEKIILYGDTNEEVQFSDFLKCHCPIEEFEAVPVQGWIDTAFILFSSGTTGLPKAVPLTHYNLIVCFKNCAFDWKKYNSQRMLSTREWYYTYGLLHTMASLIVGATVVFTEKNTTLEFLAAIDKYKVNVIQVVPSTINEMVKSPLPDDIDPSSLKFFMSTSTPIDSELIKAAKRRFPNMQAMYQIYGMSEAGCLASDLATPMGIKPGSVGVLCSGTVFKVLDQVTGKAVGPNQRGEICFKAYSLMPGYIGDVKADLDEEGFFRSGDIGYYDEDNYFYIVDRIKNIIKYGGATISPVEVESILITHPAVFEAGVTTILTEYDEAPVAFVVMQEDAVTSEKELVEYVDKHMPSVRLVGGVRFVDKLPRGANKKLDRKTLKEALQN